jgi:type I site-specific restriction-modification system R (restriction) subunit
VELQFEWRSVGARLREVADLFFVLAARERRWATRRARSLGHARIEAIRVIQRLDAPSVVTNNVAFHKFLFEGVTIEASGKDGETLNITVNLIDFEDPEANENRVPSG